MEEEEPRDEWQQSRVAAFVKFGPFDSICSVTPLPDAGANAWQMLGVMAAEKECSEADLQLRHNARDKLEHHN